MRRGFEKVSGYEYVNLPQRKTKQSAGYDIESAIDDVITPGETKLIPTGLKAYMCESEWLGIYIRSSIAVKHGIILANNKDCRDFRTTGQKAGAIQQDTEQSEMEWHSPVLTM